jgi:hypothetical protein
VLIAADEQGFLLENGGALAGPSQQKKTHVRNFEVRPTKLERRKISMMMFT